MGIPDRGREVGCSEDPKQKEEVLPGESKDRQPHKTLLDTWKLKTTQMLVRTCRGDSQYLRWSPPTNKKTGCL